MNIFTKRRRIMLHSLEIASVIITSIYTQRQKCYLTFHSRSPYCLFVWEVVILPVLADEEKLLEQFPAKIDGSFTVYSFTLCILLQMHFSFWLSALFEIRHCIMYCIEYRAKSKKCGV